MKNNAQSSQELNFAPFDEIKSLFKKDPSTTDPHYLTINRALKVLEDSTQLSPTFRKEVMPSFPTFRGDKYKNTLPYVPHSGIPHRLRPYTSLLKRLSAIAFKEIDKIETELTLRDHLLPRRRSLLKSNLYDLTNSSHPVWENWLLSLHEHQYGLIDDAVRDWLNEPIDYDESDLFKKDWDDVLYSAKAAKLFFDQIDPQVLSFLGIEPAYFEYKSSGKSVLLYSMKISVKLANQRAKALDAKFRFKLF